MRYGVRAGYSDKTEEFCLHPKYPGQLLTRSTCPAPTPPPCLLQVGAQGLKSQRQHAVLVPIILIPGGRLASDAAGAILGN